MSALRFPIRFWLVLMIWFAVAFVALRNGTQFWLGVIATLTVLAMALALQRAFSRHCARRWFWMGFLLGSMGYLLLSFGPRVDHWQDAFEKQQTLAAEETLRDNSIPIGSNTRPSLLWASRFLRQMRDWISASPGELDRHSTISAFVDIIASQSGAYQGIGHLVLSWLAGLGCAAMLDVMTGFLQAKKHAKLQQSHADSIGEKSTAP